MVSHRMLPFLLLLLAAITVLALDENSEDKTATSSEYGGGDGGRDNEGYLDMGAYSSQNGAFGWYAGYPIGIY
ncbi:hypothetical protein BIW11_08782 [Tropilaelaps mercedesae]|uniref:Uncharacterized protein n=1 Tax=Tropilaelaps mercedesae TaxID=418985 RepID=A0A1V9XNF4_9ACAR|nr:hypothetical protein BIW11_08782 [Tropilaelaps mercedesae]